MTQNRSFSFIALPVLIAGLTGCVVGPKYKRPAVDVPGTYRGATAGAPKAEAQPVQDQAEQPRGHLLPNHWVTKNGGRFFRTPNCRN